jgi:hypothetical protein
LTVVAPIVRFNALDIFVTPTFFFARAFGSRTSDEVHARLTNFLAIFVSSFFWNRPLTTIPIFCNTPNSHGTDTFMPTRKQSRLCDQLSGKHFRSDTARSRNICGRTFRREHMSSAAPQTRTLLDAVGTTHKKESRLRCHKRPKSREETPKEGSDSGMGLGVATA